jgi:hypothetical protein
VVCEELDWIHFEVKAVERLNIEDAMEQARRDCGLRIADCGMQKVPVVAHRRSYRRWLVTMDAETFFNFLRGVVPQSSGVEGRVTSDERQKKGTDATKGTDGGAKGANGTEGLGVTPEPTRETRVLPTTNQDNECRALTSAATTKE